MVLDENRDYKKEPLSEKEVDDLINHLNALHVKAILLKTCSPYYDEVKPQEPAEK